MKKFFSLLSVLLTLAIVLVGCSGSKPAASTPATSGEPAEWKFDRKIEIVCPWGAGGGADSTLRPLASELEKVLGVPVTVNNVEGAGGVKGVEYTVKQPADGYTFMLGTQSLLIASINGLSSVDVSTELIPVTRLVHDTNVVIASAKAEYKTFTELVEYIKKNPGKVKIGVMSITGVDGLGVKQLFSEAGVEVEALAFSNGAELNAAILGGHVSLGLTGVAEVSGLVASGDIVPLIVLSDKRLPVIPDVEATGDIEGLNATMGPYRGIFAKKGTPEAAIKALEAAIAKAYNTPAYDEFRKANSLDQRPGYLNAEDFAKLWAQDTADLKKLLGK